MAIKIKLKYYIESVLKIALQEHLTGIPFFNTAQFGF